MSKPTSKAVAKPQPTSLIDMASAERPDFMANSNRGSEGVTTQDMVIPRLDIVQSLSPYRKKSDPKFIEGAVEGDIINSVSRRNYGSNVVIIPVVFRKEWVIWKKRDAGGGIHSVHDSEQSAVRAMGDMDESDRDDYEILDTAVHFCLLVTPETTIENMNETVEEVVVSMTKSKMKVSRQLNSLVRMGGGDRFSRMYELSTVEDENKNGDSFNNWSVKQKGFCPEPLYLRAESLYNSVSSGAKSADHGDDAGM